MVAALYAALVMAGVYFGVHWAFVAVMSAKSKQLSAYWSAMLYPLAFIGLVLDVAFNLTFGTLMYRELPRELLFTSRCQRHARGEGSRQRLALWWAKQLNQFDAEHIKL